MRNVLLLTIALISFSVRMPASAAVFRLVNAAGPGDTTICLKVFGGNFVEKSSITFLNLGAAFPNQLLSVVIKGSDRDKFKVAPETAYDKQTICVTGKFEIFKGKPQIAVSDPDQIKMVY